MAILKKQLKLQIPAGKATPTPPIGPALGQAGINIGEFITKFNAATAPMMGDVIPVIINVYDDRSFDFVLKTPPAANLLLKAIKAEKGSGAPNTKKIGKITKAQVREIAEKKMVDMNTSNVESAMKMVAGTAKNMGIDIV
ncbi:MAG: 50S ribosomal protein L11 [Parcubacteria group bacterium RIFOXYD2_FULL_52_8]|nr:MAG: 50S ribosomal protein L11 [Parcubacteria group bacterium RIFOXYD2_FULL_52_8]